MPVYYSQQGEDALLWALFQSQKEPGYFVEVGALDGTRFSNTYSFELAGWTGICIEAHQGYIALLNENRLNSICVHAAVAEENRNACKFYANSRGSLSTLDPSQEEHFRQKHGKYFTGFELQTVPMMTLDRILQDANAPVPLDIVSIDVEGTEMQVLKGFDVEKYEPRVLVIEAMSDEEKAEMYVYMKRLGYIKARELGGNGFYCRNRKDARTIAHASNNVPLVHTKHPLDTGDDDIVESRQVVTHGLLYRIVRKAYRTLSNSLKYKNGK